MPAIDHILVLGDDVLAPCYLVEAALDAVLVSLAYGVLLPDYHVAASLADGVRGALDTVAAPDYLIADPVEGVLAA